MHPPAGEVPDGLVERLSEGNARFILGIETIFDLLARLEFGTVCVPSVT